MPPGEGTQRPTVRLKDVARIAGVSPQTVSNVINGRGGYGLATRTAVMEAVERTGYLPNRAARQLRTNRYSQIGFLLDRGALSADNPFTLELVRETSDAASALGQRVVLFPQERTDIHEVEHHARTGEVDGFVLSNVTPGDPTTRRLADLGVPFVAMGRTSAAEPQAWVDVDNRSAMRELVDHVVAHGHRDIAFLGYPGHEHWIVERREAVLGRLVELALTPPSEHVLTCAHADAVPALDRLLTSRRRPTAVIAGSDTLALLCTVRARALGVQVGRELAVTGFDSGHPVSTVEPSLTSVRIPMDQVAELLVARLLREIEQGPTRDPGQLVSTRLVVGESA